MLRTVAADELQTLALSRGRAQADALLCVLQASMVEVEDAARLALCCLLAEGHLLIEDVPGVGKTTLARIMARAIGGHDGRIQCTSDLTAADVIGREREGSGLSREPELDPGPIFANAVVFDELNRATPQLQSALLEAMEERCVTLGKTRHRLPRPFFVVATMNPHDQEGTYELPHPQRDRFAMRISLGYASEAGELALLERFSAFDVTADIDPIVAPGDVVKLQRAVSLVPATDEARGYLVRLLRATRVHRDVLVGASPRSMLSTYRCCQALALIDGVDAVTPAHVRELLGPCIGHRLRYRDGAEERQVLADVLDAVAEPVERPRYGVALRRPAAAA